MTTDWTENFTLYDTNDTQTSGSYVQVTTATLSDDVLTCPQQAVPCNDTLGNLDLCLNQGLCCFFYLQKKSYCRCPLEYSGTRCHLKNDELDYLIDSLPSRQQEMFFATEVSSVISLTIGLAAIVAFVVLAAFVIRRRMLQQQHPKECLERHLSEIQDELDRLPTIHKLIHLTRLTRIFEAKTMATAKATVLYATSGGAIGAGAGAGADKAGDTGRQLGQSWRSECLPRWSSAPSILSTPTSQSAAQDETDNVMEQVDKRKLQLVMSLDERRTLQHDTRL
jgi:hypothetical protein